MQLGILTDTHAGARNNSTTFIDIQKRFYSEVFFPEIDKRKIKTILHLGDFWESRKAVNLLAMHEMMKMFLEPFEERKLKMHIIPGNHDLAWKHSLEINSSEMFLNSENIHHYTSPCQLDFKKCKIAMIPWICDENREECLSFIKKSKAEVLCGHFDVIGFEMFKGMLNKDQGLSIETFGHFSQVFSGHYHHRSKISNVQYLGSPFQLTWADYQDERGFHIFDTDTEQLEFIENPFSTFQKVYYNDEKYDSDTILNQDFSILKDKIVKVVVQHKNNPYCFEQFIEAVHAAGAVDVSVIDDVFDVSLEYEEDDEDVSKDTLTLITEYTKVACDTNKEIGKFEDELISTIRSLYLEAVEVDNTVNA